ncbi:MAG: hypothetical protein HOP37_01700 [Cyclobacteriaceae bacterium]|nr:hypothetical protein [Cyclobacteriaceae bacterium]
MDGSKQESIDLSPILVRSLIGKPPQPQSSLRLERWDGLRKAACRCLTISSHMGVKVT